MLKNPKLAEIFRLSSWGTLCCPSAEYKEDPRAQSQKEMKKKRRLTYKDESQEQWRTWKLAGVQWKEPVERLGGLI